MGFSLGIIAVVFLCAATFQFAEGLKCYHCGHDSTTINSTETVNERRNDQNCRRAVRRAMGSVECGDPSAGTGKVYKCATRVVKSYYPKTKAKLVVNRKKTTTRGCSKVDKGTPDGCAPLYQDGDRGPKTVGKECTCSTDNCNGQITLDPVGMSPPNSGINGQITPDPVGMSPPNSGINGQTTLAPLKAGLKCYHCGHESTTINGTETVNERRNDQNCRDTVRSAIGSVECGDPSAGTGKVYKCTTLVGKSYDPKANGTHNGQSAKPIKTTARSCMIVDEGTPDGCEPINNFHDDGSIFVGKECYCSTDNCNWQRTLDPSGGNGGQTTLSPAILTSLCGVLLALFTTL